MGLTKNILCTVDRVVGNLEPIGAALKDIDGGVIDVTGLTIRFRMVLIALPNTVKIDSVLATIDTASTGLVSYSPSSGDMDTAGLYACYFIDDDTIDRLFPYDGANFQLNLIKETARA